MFELKSYQKLALDALESFLAECSEGTPASEVFEKNCLANGWGKGKYLDSFNGKPCVCLRVPTGGGKTVLAAAAIRRIDDAYSKTGAPVVLWLTPSDAITTQTYDALSNPEHPYRQALDADFRSVKVVRVEDVDHALTQSDFRESCIIVVSTIQTFNIQDTSLRNAYAFNENFQGFFANLKPSEAERLEKVEEKDLEEPSQTHLTKANLGRVKYSLANLLNLFDPIIIVDEAHNNRTDKFFATLNRLNPSVVLELTATPDKRYNNVIYQVSAWELKAENMVKLPVILGEFTNGWEGCIDESIKIQRLLEAKAALEPEYIRPIVLVQAQPKDQNPTPEEVKTYLMETCGIPEAQIAIATGSTKELTGVDLFAKTCPVRFVITVKALKEGWDCSLAYVLCSLQNIQSAKDVEQLLGRVMRMPYAKARTTPELNRSYANVVSASTLTAAALLKDRLVENLGFNRIEADSIVEHEEEKNSLFPDTELTDSVASKTSSLVLTTKVDLKQAIEDAGLTGTVSVAPVTMPSGKHILQVSSSADPEKLRTLVHSVSQKVPEKAATENAEALAGLFYERARKRIPENDTPFPALPLLTYESEGSPRLLSQETVMTDAWNPILYGTKLDFAPTSRINRSQIDTTENHTLQMERLAEDAVLPFDSVPVADSPDLLVKWLRNRLRRSDVFPLVMLKFVETVVVNGLMGEKGMSLAKLTAHKVELATAIERLLEENYRKAVKEGFNQALFTLVNSDDFPDTAYEFKFDPSRYMPRRTYNPAEGGREFKKHFCPLIHDLHVFRSDGKIYAEEYLCAEAIDTTPDVKRWIRNIERSDDAFWLPLADGRFYPDFLLELTNGKILVVEYKGANLYTNEESQQKRRVGQVWEKTSKGRCFFLMARDKDEQGRNVAAQIQAKIDQIMER